MDAQFGQSVPVDPSAREYSLRLARYHRLAETISEYAESKSRGGPKLRLLDVGVGRGRTLRYLADSGVSDRIRYFGVDISPRRLDSVYRADEWLLLRSDAEAGLPFESGAFDIVICEQVLEHLDTPEVALKEILRVAKGGALCVIGVPSFPPAFAWIRKHAVSRFDRLRGASRSHPQTFTLAGLITMIESHPGVKVVEARGFRFISGGPLRPLEDFRWWYEFNQRLGKRFPTYATEVQVKCIKVDRSPNTNATRQPLWQWHQAEVAERRVGAVAADDKA